ncbi:A/G-specific adenine glycosylase [Staphylococcus sp. SQ8-PEA]|uniref:Adenine DNA glycosylase n=1 Tax=Staphylococcus marylandisciuri TaxID=2981529 RepID=A0ABT2QQH5_9STAP|nr:A/G-specific adenine glycosylase [Staphylococcus marylandisciuri]MCU5746238.1 A/G-specific adenine glycosylase [Staphylococcus marylandisciuri]
MLHPTTFKKDLLHWFEENQRQMPWRETTNPYYIWLSEVMLQQTQVNTVRDYYHRFIKQFPTIKDLSQANEDEVLKMWEGLGYYSRARNFHTAVKEVEHTYNGIVPRDPERFGALKGVGPYTQAAVMSIAFDLALPTVDGNVFRVWSRLNSDYRDTKLQSTRRAFEEELQPFVRSEAGQFNQAMMELGAMVCTPKAPLCLFCPVQEHCQAFSKGTVMDLPVKPTKVKKKIKEMHVYIIENDENEVLVEQRQAKLLNGMWQFPMFEASKDNPLKNIVDVFENLAFEYCKSIKHQFTHLTWDIKVFKLKARIDKAQVKLTSNMRWMDVDEKELYNFPVVMTKIYESLIDRKWRE